MRTLLTLLCSVALLAACGSTDDTSTDTPGGDAVDDTTADGSTEADAGADTTPDDTGGEPTDADDDAADDAADDAGDDVTAPDASPDADPDATVDTTPDADPDATVDATPDATIDADLDATTDTSDDATDPDSGLVCAWNDPGTCGDGQWCDVPDGQCADNPTPGTCETRPEGCPRIYDPVCGCDGETYSNSCIADAAGVNIAASGECDVTDTCRSDRDCERGSYCAFAAGACAAPGTCEDIPTACPDIYRPVCGCDGETYGNECEAASAGVSVASEGECETTEGCRSSRECLRGQYCMFETGACAAPGVCESRPEGCPDLWDPVCGCDGTTYGNACEAATAGVSVASMGECASTDACSSNRECDLTDYCAFRPLTCDGPGACEPRPDACPGIYDPVCGCDGRTYSNSCVAASSGANVASRGVCE